MNINSSGELLKSSNFSSFKNLHNLLHEPSNGKDIISIILSYYQQSYISQNSIIMLQINDNNVSILFDMLI